MPFCLNTFRCLLFWSKFLLISTKISEISDFFLVKFLKFPECFISAEIHRNETEKGRRKNHENIGNFFMAGTVVYIH